MRSSRSTPVLLAVLVLSLLALPSAAEEPGTIQKTDNVREIAQHRYTGGTEIAFDGDFAYAGQFNGVDNRGQEPDQGGVFIFSIADGGFDLIGKIDCPGTDTVVEVVRPGLIAVGHHESACNETANFGDGFYLVDTSDIDPDASVEDNSIFVGDPRIVGTFGQIDTPGLLSSHTITPHPDGDYIYVSPGGLVNGDSEVRIVDVSDPTTPTLVDTFGHNDTGCHDLQFLLAEDGHYVFCAGLGEVSVWNVNDPEAPAVIGGFTNPAIQFPHNAVPSPDGTLLVINDEAFAAHECQSETSIFGSLWVYDITDRANPVLVSKIAPPVGESVAGYSGPDLVGIDGRPLGPNGGWTRSWCAAHNYNFVPGTNTVVAGWFNGGVTVEDLSDPAAPQRIASYRAAPSIVYTAHFHQTDDGTGRIYVNDLNRGMEVLEVDGLVAHPEAGIAAAPVPSGARDRSAQLIPAVLPPRPARIAPDLDNRAFCVIPGV